MKEQKQSVSSLSEWVPTMRVDDAVCSVRDRLRSERPLGDEDSP
jgi:hypothetical protein